MAKQSKTPLDVITPNLKDLSLQELEELVDMVQGLIDVKLSTGDFEVGIVDPMTQAITSNHSGKRGGKGHIEAKTINGYGPYLYLRYWHGGKLRSKYLGKKESQS